MTVFYFVRSLEAVPSCMYNIQMIADAGFEVIVATGRSTESMNNIMKSKNILFFDGRAVKKNNSLLQKVLNRFRLTDAIKKSVKDALKKYKKGDIVFWGTADTALSVHQYCKSSTNILSLKELHETPWYYPIRLKKIASKCSAVICCEKNRARVLQFRWKLSKRPYVISNKPYGYPTDRHLLPTSDITKKVISQISSDKVIVYQARHVHFTNELINLACALKHSNKNYQLVIIGEVDNPSDKERIADIYSNVLWTGHIPAPFHLEITSYAQIGVAVYAETSLNNLFCAPNKTYEYAGFGIPTLCNDVPGLVDSIGLSRAGICVDWDDVNSIQNGIEELFSSYETYSEYAKSFYYSEDNKQKIESIIKEIINRRNKNG